MDQDFSDPHRRCSKGYGSVITLSLKCGLTKVATTMSGIIYILSIGMFFEVITDLTYAFGMSPQEQQISYQIDMSMDEIDKAIMDQTYFIAHYDMKQIISKIKATRGSTIVTDRQLDRLAMFLGRGDLDLKLDIFQIFDLVGVRSLREENILLKFFIEERCFDYARSGGFIINGTAFISDYYENILKKIGSSHLKETFNCPAQLDRFNK